MLFYEIIGDGPKDFVDTYDANKGAQDPDHLARCFEELERIAKQVVERFRTAPASLPRARSKKAEDKKGRRPQVFEF